MMVEMMGRDESPLPSDQSSYNSCQEYKVVTKRSNPCTAREECPTGRKVEGDSENKQKPIPSGLEHITTLNFD